MPLSKELLSCPISDMIRNRYNLDDLEIDGSTRPMTAVEPDVIRESEITYGGLLTKPHTEIRKCEFYHLMVRWRIGSNAWHALVPVEVEKYNTYSSGIRSFFKQGYVHTGYDWKIDNEGIINNICKVIEESIGDRS